LNKRFQNSGPHRIKIPVSEGHSFWLRLFPYTDTNYLATHYTPYEEGWARGFSDKGMVLHKSKIDEGVQINRVFIVANEREYDGLKNVIRFQKEIGVNVRYIEISRVRKISILHKNIRKLGTYDFAVLDGTHVFMVFLDRIVNGRASNSVTIKRHWRWPSKSTRISGKKLLPHEPGF
jgi:hypothetical protein